MRWQWVAAFLLFSLSVSAQDANKNPNKKEPPILGPHWARGVANPHPATTSPDMTYHGGPILPSVTAKAIFSGSSWPTYTGDEISGLDKWYNGVGTKTNGGGSSYFATVNEYTDS